MKADEEEKNTMDMQPTQTRILETATFVVAMMSELKLNKEK